MSAFKKLRKREAELELHEKNIRRNDDSESSEVDEEERLKRQKVQEELGESDKSSVDSQKADSEKGSVAEDETTAAEQEVDPEDELRAFKDADPSSKEWKNR